MPTYRNRLSLTNRDKRPTPREQFARVHTPFFPQQTAHRAKYCETGVLSSLYYPQLNISFPAPRNRSAILTVLSPIKYIFSGTKLEMIFHNTEVGFRVKTKPRLSFHLVAVPLEFEFLLIHRCRCEERSFKS